MTILEKIKADIKRHQIMACYDLDGQLAVIDAHALSQTADTPSYKVDNQTAVINVRGLLIPQAGTDYGHSITGYDTIGNYLIKADKDPFIKNIVLDIDSNGGYTKGLDDVIAIIGNLSKSVSTYASGNMQSAGYWLGASTGYIVANKSSNIGSIGVFVVHHEQAQALINQGQTFSIFKSGLWKGAFSFFKPLANHEKERLQQTVDDTAQQFFEHIAKQRGIDTQVIKDWQGDSFNANKAYLIGLIDEINQNTIHTTNPQEMSMDLTQALADISNLQGQITQKDSVIADKQVMIDNLQKQLSEQKANHRQAKIDELSQTTGKSFSDDEIRAFLAMDDTGFNLAFNLACQKPTLPKGLDTHQALHGVSQSNSVSDKINEWGNQ